MKEAPKRGSFFFVCTEVLYLKSGISATFSIFTLG